MLRFGRFLYLRALGCKFLRQNLPVLPGNSASISSLFGGDNSNSQFGFANSRSNLPPASSSNQPQGDKIVGGGAPKQPIWAAISKA